MSDFIKAAYEIDVDALREQYAEDTQITRLLTILQDLVDPERVMTHVAGCEECSLCDVHSKRNVSVHAQKADAIWMFHAQRHIAATGTRMMQLGIHIRALESSLAMSDEVTTMVDAALELVAGSLRQFEPKADKITMPVAWRDGMLNTIATVKASYSRTKADLINGVPEPEEQSLDDR